MSKDQIVSQALASISSGQAQVLADAIGVAVDQSALEQKASDGTLSQADLDKAVADAVSAAQAVDAQALADAQAKAQADLAALQASLDSVTAKELGEEAAVKALQDAMAAVQASWDAVKALFPAPQP